MEHEESQSKRTSVGRIVLTDKNLTTVGKKKIAYGMCQRGNAFLGAAILLQRCNGDGWVVLHNLCQGIELLLKGILLLCDFDEFKPKLKKPLGHNLEKLERQVRKKLGLKRKDLSLALATELKVLNHHYQRNLLRYADGGYALLVDARNIQSDRVLTRIAKISVRIVAAANVSKAGVC